MSFSHIFTRVMALDLLQNLLSSQYLENKLTDFHQISIYEFILTRSRLRLLHGIFTHLYQSYIFYLCQNFVSAQYFENKLTEFLHILNMNC